MARGKQSLTRNLFGAGKGDRTRPCEVPRDTERANYCLAFKQCYLCAARNIDPTYNYKSTVICWACNREKYNDG